MKKDGIKIMLRKYTLSLHYARKGLFPSSAEGNEGHQFNIYIVPN